MANSLYPAYVEINYQSAFGVHQMRLPTRAFNVANNEFSTWSGGVIDATVMIAELVDDMAEFFAPTTEFTDYIIYTLATPTSDAEPVASAPLATPGVSVGTGWSKAIQQTFTFRTTEFGISKLVFLDPVTSNNFDRVTDGSTPAALAALIADWTKETAAWSGRDNARPATFVQIAYTLNEKLRREYRMN